MEPAALSKPFPPDVVSWRVGSTTQDKKRGMALAYIDARDVQDRLNEACGPFGWQCKHEVANDKRVTCHIGIRNPETGEWVWRSDGAGETDYEAEKGSYSDSFKRAAVKWGIGRYLYDVSSPWVEIEQHGKSYSIKDSERGKLRACLPSGPQRPVETPRAQEASKTAPRQDAPNTVIPLAPEDRTGAFISLEAELHTCIAPDHLHGWDRKVVASKDAGALTDNAIAHLRRMREARRQLVVNPPGGLLEQAPKRSAA